MKNYDYINEQKVFEFINNNYRVFIEKDNGFDCLIDFLKKNNLPLKPSWAFYLFGKINLIDEKVIQEMSINSETRYGGHINGEVYYWNEFLNEDKEFSTREEIYKKLTEENKELDQLKIYELYIKKGWEYVEECICNDIESQRIWDDYEWDKEIEQKYVDNDNDEPPFCDACQSSPCMCSDRERTSTVYDY